MRYGLKVRGTSNPAIDGVDIYLISYNQDGSLTWVEGGVTTERNEPIGANVPVNSIRPFFQLDREQCQQLMDVLQERGFEPDSNAKLKGKLEATERHLEDMRKLVFKPLERGEI